MRRLWLAAALAIVAGRAEAGFIVTAIETPGGVVFSGGGNLDLNGATLNAMTTDEAAISPAAGLLVIGPTSFTLDDAYSPLTGPKSFGAGGIVAASSGFGDHVGFSTTFDPSGVIVVPHGYTSGAPLESSSTYAGATFASLGMTPGTYVYTLPSSDTFTLQIGAAVPEPSSLSLALCGLGAVGLAGYARRRKARA
jgi:hypothetical protein